MLQNLLMNLREVKLWRSLQNIKSRFKFPFLNREDTALDIMRGSVYDGGLWMVEANLMKHFYYETNCQRSSAWINLGTAIRHAQESGLHRKIINEKFKNLSFQLKQKYNLELFINISNYFNTSRKLNISNNKFIQFNVSSKNDIQNIINFFSLWCIEDTYLCILTFLYSDN